MSNPRNIVATIVEEDRLLRDNLTRCPVRFREIPGPGGSLSFKETLGHLAFWDTFAVEFFTQKLDQSTPKPEPPDDFEQRSRQELQRVRKLSFDKVLAYYSEATSRLLDFLEDFWGDLSEKQRRDFLVPVKHRRHHRLKLARALLSWEKSPPRERVGEA